MNAHGKAGRAASIVSSIAALLLAHTVAADDEIIVYGERPERPAEPGLAPPPIDSAEFLEALHDELRASLREGLEAAVAPPAKDSAARAVKVATVSAPSRG